MQFIDSDFQFPISSAVVHSGRVFEAFVTGIPDRERQPVPSGAGAETREIFCQLDTFLAAANVDRFAVCTARLYLRDVLVDIAAVNVAWKRTGREGTARTGEELADPALPERVRCARFISRNSRTTDSFAASEWGEFLDLWGPQPACALSRRMDWRHEPTISTSA